MLIAVSHATFILAFCLSPFLLNWRIIFVLIILYYLQLAILGNCILTMLQFKEKYRTTTFYSYVLELFGFRLDRHKVRIVVDYYLPWIVFLTALIYQVFLGHRVLFGNWF
jgi:hypothetical protein